MESTALYPFNTPDRLILPGNAEFGGDQSSIAASTGYTRSAITS